MRHMGHLHQTGQALAEALIVLAVLGSLWLGIIWLGRLQDIGLQLAHASRWAAFAHAHQGFSPAADAYLAVPGHRWASRRGQTLLADTASVAVVPLGPQAGLQPGDPAADAAAWRTELRLGDPMIWRAVAQVTTVGEPAPQGTLLDFDHVSLHLRRATAILSGDGAAASDAEGQATLAGSARAWRRIASASQAAGKAVTARAAAVDAAWGRALPDWNWIHPWTGSVPRPHLQPWRQP